ncbi:MAG TPA: DUF3426 domain-containing protein [Pseudomonas sp.]|uniref:DUF3426 domain-containing protein n=1 Tax=Pseudomonas sp. TaxID=306 RepID=UPI002ED77FFD
MTDSFVTQCPHCQTSFRVSHAQLSVARGVVRCGSCLQVFNAAKQLLEQRAEQPQAPETSAPQQNAAAPIATPAALPVAPSTPPAPEPVIEPPMPVVKHEPPQLDLDSLDLDDLDVELARLEQREIQLPESFGRANNTRDLDHVESMSARRGDADTAHEHWNEALTNDDVDQLPELKAEVVGGRNDDAPLQTSYEPDDQQPYKTHDNRTEPSLSSQADDFDDEPVKHTTLIDHDFEGIDHERDFGHKRDATDELERDDPTPERFSALDGDDEAHRDHDSDEAEPESRSKRRRNEPGLRDDALLDLMDDPLQLAWQKPKPRWGRRLFWLLLVLIALGALAGQYVWYHFDELARQDQYRPLFQELCPQVGCKVPSKVDITLLKSSNLVVRSHPDFQGALVVDAIIYNRASFSQPFPLLELRFADINGQLIASRRFKPGEYLSGELAGKEEMPPQTPIHISLDILDPGAKAANYSLSFRSPE